MKTICSDVLVYAMRIYDRRVHLLLDEGRYRRVAIEANRRGMSIATVVRDAIDLLPIVGDTRREAVAATVASSS